MSKKDKKSKVQTTLVDHVVVNTPIKDFYTTDNQGIILINGTTMQDIYKKSGPLANANEFQVHYWFLNFRFRAEDNSILDIAIPTCYFNYEQFVSGGHIDFELQDVKDLSAKLLPLHNMKTNQLIDMGIKERLEEIFNVTFEMMSMDFGSIHKHPGGSRSQSFSGTDYCKTASEPGVVFPLASASDDTPNFAGIMALDSQECNVAHYEYRTVNGTLGTDIEYIEGRCAAFMVYPEKKDERSLIEKLLNFGSELSSKWKFKRCTEKLSVVPAMEAIGKWLYLEQSYVASTDAVIPDNVKKTASVSYHYGVTSKKPYVEIPTFKALNKLSPFQLNEHYKVCCAKLSMIVPKYEATKPILITGILKTQKVIAEMMAPYTEKMLERKLIKELNTLHNLKYFEANGVTMYRYLTSRDIIIKDILELQAKEEAKTPEPVKEEPFKILTEEELLKLNYRELVEQTNRINAEYYGDDAADDVWVTEPYTVATAPEQDVLISEVLSVQKWLLMEIAEQKKEIELEKEPDPIIPSIEEIKADLAPMNIDPQALASASDEQIRTWYMSLDNLN